MPTLMTYNTYKFCHQGANLTHSHTQKSPEPDGTDKQSFGLNEGGQRRKGILGNVVESMAVVWSVLWGGLLTGGSRRWWR